MLDGVPNMAFALGYTNASWTLKVDMVSAWVARLLRRMAREGAAVVVPQLPEAPLTTSPFIEMSSGYFERARHTLPLQGDRAPWRLRQHPVKDAALYRGPDEHVDLRFSGPPAREDGAEELSRLRGTG
jgi:monooxygenase